MDDYDIICCLNQPIWYLSMYPNAQIMRTIEEILVENMRNKKCAGGGLSVVHCHGYKDM